MVGVSEKHAPVRAPSIEAAQAALTRGDLEAAERICVGLSKSTPQDGRVWTLLTETALLRGRLDAALACAKRAVAVAPKDALAHIVQAKCLFLAGDAEQALAAARRAQKIPHLSASAADALGAIFGFLARHDAALTLFSRATALEPRIAQYKINLAATHRMRGALDAAETACAEALALDPGFALAHYIRSDLRIQTAGRNHIADMETALAAPDLHPENAILLRYALAKEHEDIGDDARAFDHVAQGAEIQRAGSAPAIKAELAEIAGAASLAPPLATQGGCAAAAPIFVAGLPRSGTTLVERIVGGLKETTPIGETDAFAAALRAAATPFDIGQRYIRRTEAVYASAQARVIDKTLRNFLYCGHIHAALPRAKIILLRRHPLDMVWALYKAHFRGQFAFSYDLEAIADYILAYRRLIRHWEQRLPKEALLIVAYEDIVRDLEGESRRIVDFLDLPWSETTLQFHACAAPSATASAVQIRRPLYDSSVGRWRRHAARLAPARARLARELSAEELD